MTRAGIPLLLTAVAAASLARGAAGLDNGLALTPPMGWRSWNCYHVRARNLGPVCRLSLVPGPLALALF